MGIVNIQDRLGAGVQQGSQLVIQADRKIVFSHKMDNIVPVGRLGMIFHVSRGKVFSETVEMVLPEGIDPIA
jgi:hypothetical protein